MSIALSRARVHARALLLVAVFATGDLLPPTPALAAEVAVKIDNFTFGPE